jgi:hypothetical protein
LSAKGIHHVDLAVTDVARSLSFYLMLLEPLGFAEYARYPRHRGIGAWPAEGHVR